MANNEVTTGRFTKKDFRGVFWRSFTLLGSFNYERMEGLGFLYAIMPLLRKIYKDDDEGVAAQNFCQNFSKLLTKLFGKYFRYL